MVIGQTKVSEFLYRAEFLYRLEFLEKPEFLDRLDWIDRTKCLLYRMECLDKIVSLRVRATLAFRSQNTIVKLNWKQDEYSCISI